MGSYLRRLVRRPLALIGLFCVALMATLMTALPVQALPSLPLVSPVLMQFSGGSGSASSYSLGWVELDGEQVFQVAAPASSLSQRQQHVKGNLEAILQNYLQLETPVANVSVAQAEGYDVPSVYINGQYLMTVTKEDALLQGTTPAGFVEELKQAVPEALSQAHQQRQPDNVRQQAIWSAGVIGVALLIVLALEYWKDPIFRGFLRLFNHHPNTDAMAPEQRHHLHDIQVRLWPLLQGAILVGAIVWVIGHFPETRGLQADILTTAKVPLILIIVVVVAYVGIRLSYATIDKFVASLTREEDSERAYSRRTNLRITTLSSVIKNIANFVWLGFGLIVALSITGINLGLLLASVGIIGLALSLAAQNLVSGAIKGFFIVLEDQYAIGDIVKIDENAGLVEKMNLRITQLRDTAGRLITIPTSDIDRVANFSLHWSRADLKIPVHYNADINQMLNIARQVGDELDNDPDWGYLILEEPQILGVDDFGDSAVILRIWIKTQPMKQWDIAREYRRRFKLAVEAAGTEIPFPQRDVWLHPADEFSISLNREFQSNSDTDGSTEGNGHHSAETDRQPRTVPDEEGGEGDGK